jgi:SM-20-related protein
LEKAFEAIIDSFLEKRVGLSENFLELSLSNDLKGNLLSLFLEKKLKEAGIGNQKSFNKDKLIRGDKIYWLDRKHNNFIENNFLDIIDQFVKYLNETCYAGITGYEFHYALYEKGSFYKRHLDQFQDNKKRAYSMIIYLNENWIKLDGGELCIFNLDNSQIISPNNRKCVFFKSSELEHEVLITNKQRLSITGWLKTN